jgi:5S rRNA maturation endonuclease (ribonuclease M5)
VKLNDIINFLKLLGIGEIKISDDEEWARCSCPLSPFTHVKGSDENPSFGIKVNNSGTSGYNCFTCGSGSLWDMIHRMNFTTGVPKQATDFFGIAEIFDEDDIRNEEQGFRVGGYYDDIYSLVFLQDKKIEVPREVLGLYPLLEDSIYTDHKAEVEAYFLSRGIMPNCLYDYGVRHSPENRFIIFPIFDTDGEAYRLHVKLVKEKTFWYLTPALVGRPDLEQWGRKDYWFGIQFYDPILPVVIVESETDVMRLRCLGVNNVIATCGPLNKFKAGRISNRTLLLGFDCDQAGSKYTMKAISLWKDRQLFRLNWNLVNVSYFTPKKRIEKKRVAEDAGDLETREQFDYIVDNKVSLGQLETTPMTGYKDVWS